jgi:hypothetical protein
MTQLKKFPRIRTQQLLGLAQRLLICSKTRMGEELKDWAHMWGAKVCPGSGLELIHSLVGEVTE